MLVVVGTGLELVMVNVWGPETPPPGAGLNTVTWAVPATAMSEAGTVAVNCVAETKVVARSEPFQRTTEVLTKLVPFTVRVKLPPPATAELGLMLVVTGTGEPVPPPTVTIMSSKSTA
jgi:hypothetical protein